MGQRPCWPDSGARVPSLRGASADGLRPHWTPGHIVSELLGRLGAEGEVWPPGPVVLPVPAWDVARTAHLSAQQILTKPPTCCWARPRPRLALAGLHVTLSPLHTCPLVDAKALCSKPLLLPKTLFFCVRFGKNVCSPLIFLSIFLFFPSDAAPLSGLPIKAEPQQPLSAASRPSWWLSQNTCQGRGQKSTRHCSLFLSQ